MNSPIDNLLTRIDRLLLREITEPDQTAFLQSIKNLLKTYRVEPEQFSDMLLNVYDIEKKFEKRLNIQQFYNYNQQVCDAPW